MYHPIIHVKDDEDSQDVQAVKDALSGGAVDYVSVALATDVVD